MTGGVIDACLATFAETVTYKPLDLAALEIQAIFDAEFESVDPATGTPIISNSPMIGVKEADLPRPPARGDKVIIRGIEYRVVESQTDGQAAASLLLNKI